MGIGYNVGSSTLWSWVRASSPIYPNRLFNYLSCRWCYGTFRCNEILCVESGVNYCSLLKTNERIAHGSLLSDAGIVEWFSYRPGGYFGNQFASIKNEIARANIIFMPVSQSIPLEVPYWGVKLRQIADQNVFKAWFDCIQATVPIPWARGWDWGLRLS